MFHSPDDLDQPNYIFAKEIKLALVFFYFVERPKMFEALLGGSIDPKLMSQLHPALQGPGCKPPHGLLMSGSGHRSVAA